MKEKICNEITRVLDLMSKSLPADEKEANVLRTYALVIESLVISLGRIEELK